MNSYEKASIKGLARTLAGKYYTSGEIFQQELDRIFARGWYLVGRAETLAESGDYFLATIGSESLIVVRDGDSFRALHNVCRHRGASLCEEARGRFGGSIQCPYHAWTYGLDGRLIAARLMKDVEGFDPAEYPLATATVVEWEGFLLLSLRRDASEFEKDFATVRTRFREWGIDSLREGGRIEYEVRANWKLLFQNYSECYHCPLVHPQLVPLSPWDSGRNDLLRGAFLGGYMLLTGETMNADGARTRPSLPGLSQANLGRVYYYSIMPNLLLSLHPDYVMAHTLTPKAPDRTHVTCQWLFHPETIARVDFDPGDAITFWDETNRQDWHACEISQRGISSLAYVPGPYAHSEGLLWEFDQHYLSLMREPSRSRLTPEVGA